MTDGKLKFFFKIVAFTLNSVGAFVVKKPLNSKFQTFLLYKVWPVAFDFIWVLMAISAQIKLLQYINNHDWETLLESIQIFIIGIFTIYMLPVVQLNSAAFKNVIELVEGNFKTSEKMPLSDFFMVFFIWFVLAIAFILYIGTCLYCGEVLVPLWIPFIDNDKELSGTVFYLIYVTQIIPAYLIFCCFAFWGPFILVSTICISREISHLSVSIEQFKSLHTDDILIPSGDLRNSKAGNNGTNILNEETLLSYSEIETMNYLKVLVEHHLLIKRALRNVSKIHDPVFLLQAAATVLHSCILTFNMYYTARLGKVLIKSSPILFLSYFVMFVYCWNGQRLTNKCEELHHAIYRCPWYNCSQRVKTTLLSFMEMNKKPVHLSGYGIYSATLEVFLDCLQQSMSYIMLLVTLTSPKKSS